MRNKRAKILMIWTSIFLANIISLLLAFPKNNLSAEEFSGPSTRECKALYDEIENDFKQANYCEKDEDCKVATLGGWYVDFGCYKFVNSATDEEKLFAKIRKYKDEMKCSGIIDDCSASPIPVCGNKKCVGKNK